MRLLCDRVLVRVTKRPVIDPQQRARREQLCQATVLQAGAAVDEVRPGDRILYGQFAAHRFGVLFRGLLGDDTEMIARDEVMAVIETP